MGLIHIYCGNGKGKSTASAGLALRALGTGMKVLYCQFFKNGSSGEIKALKSFDSFTYIKSEKDFPRFVNMTAEQKLGAKKYYTDLFIKVSEMTADFDMIVFDEIMSTYNHNFLDKDIVPTKIKEMSASCEIVLTGRNPAEELCEIADYISKVCKVKHPFDNGVKARKGIEF